MKKVIGVAVAASLVAGMAFADVAVTLNARLRSNLYHTKKIDGGNSTTALFDLDGSKYLTGDKDFTHGGSGTMSDTLAFSAKSDYAGVTLETAVPGTDEAVKVDGTYNGFLKFGALKFTFGRFNSRFVNRYNVTAGESGLLDSDQIAKYGIALLLNDDSDNDYGATLKDANNISAIGGSTKNALFADYTVDAGDGKLMLKGGLLSYAYKDPKSTDTDKTYNRAGYAFEADYQCDAANVQALVKLPKEKLTIFGVYADVKALPLPLAFGFSYASNSNDNEKGTAYAADARVGYQVSDELKVSSVIKYENVKGDGQTADTALTVAAEVSYVVNEMATVFADVGYYNYDLDGKSDSSVKDKTIIKFRPGVVVAAGKDARITAALQYDSWTKTKSGSTKSELSIPVIFRVKM